MRGHSSSCQRHQPRHIGAESSSRQGLERCPVRLYEPLQTITFDDDSLWAHLADGRVLAVPLARFPRLLAATPQERARFTLSPRGIHWDELDEDISIDSLLAGRGDLTHGRAGTPAPLTADQARGPI